MALAKPLARKKPKGGKLSLRAVSAELAAQGYLNERGTLFAELRRQGRDVRPELAKHVAPLGWEHIGLTGDYVWSSADSPADGSFRPLQRKESMLAA